MNVALITGIAGGIGQALGTAYRDGGYHVIGTGRAAPAAGVCDTFLPIDLALLATSDDALADFRTAVLEACDGAPLKVLVNNAATQILGDTSALTLSDWQLTMGVNVTAPFRLVQAFLPELEAARGSVLNIGSVHAQSTKPEFAAYATSKAALHGLTRALAVDLGRRVRVNCLAPAAISTPMLMAGFEGKADAFAKLEACHPVDRIGRPEECAKAALFLTSDEAAFATGAIFYLDGGVLSRLHDPV
jgi:NAD(P)-dependent dehydrogenase (short-subunit alcohol dehydrogenase family)